MDTNNGSEIDIYLINPSSTFESNTVGQAIKQEQLNGAWWDVFWKDPNDIGEFGSLEKILLFMKSLSQENKTIFSKETSIIV